MVVEVPRPPDTTVEQDKHSFAQRKINYIWEYTQAIVAVSVTLSTLYVSAKLSTEGSNTAAFLLLSNAFFLVIGFYFGRTNHSRIETPK